VGSLGSIVLAAVTGHGALGVALLASGAGAAFLFVTAITLLLTGEEIYVFFHHAIAVAATTWALAPATGMGLPRSMDYAMVGLGLCLAIGRFGCLMVGCCHGRPATHGIVYGARHVQHGFPSELVGRRLVPLQPVEAAVVVVVTAASMAVVSAGGRPGAAATLWLACYGSARFGMEFWRGEPRRLRVAGLTHAQWTALGILAVVAATGRRSLEVTLLATVASITALSAARHLIVSSAGRERSNPAATPSRTAA
jgi:prolipoprotein diacylglyceryltransferase